jgi:hypothetical protein
LDKKHEKKNKRKIKANQRERGTNTGKMEPELWSAIGPRVQQECSNTTGKK